jgi:signal peptidase II
MRRVEGGGLGRWLLFWSIAICGTSFDLATKSIVFSKVGFPAPSVPIVPRVLEIQTSHNPGALWGFGATLPGSSVIFAALSVVAAIVICYFLFVLGASASRILTVALGLIMAGAMGNCYDRLAFGYVRDFVHFHVDPIGFDCAIFNFADNMLIAGALTLVLYALRADKAPVASPVGSPAQTSYFSENGLAPELSRANEHSRPVEADSVGGAIRARAAHTPSPTSQSIHSL